MRMHHARAAISAAMATRCMAAPHRTAASSAAVAAATQVRGGVHLAKPVSLPRANPPPTSERSLGLQRLYAQHRPLLEHEQLPARPVRMMQGDVLVIEADDLAQVMPQRSIWRRRARRVDTDTFSHLLDRLSQLSLSSRKSRIVRRVRSRGFTPSSPAVLAASQYVERMEREAEIRELVMANAIEQGEDVERAARLGSEAELVVLGEPAGAHKDWAPGVATHLDTHTQPYVPPQFGSAAPPRRVRVRSIDADAAADEDAHLWLMQGLVQTRLRADHEWRTFVASKLGEAPYSVSLDSVRRKRRKKMNKHKYKKLRKRQRAERQRLKK